MASEGKQFEQSVEESAKEQSIYYFRVRDVNPMALKAGSIVPKNKFDSLMYYKGYLFPIEMKSTKDTKLSFSESIIKANQIKNLQEASNYKGVIPGFLFNFRESDNKTYFIHINDFVNYKNVVENGLKHIYKNKVNKGSIPIGICEEIGIELVNVKKKVKYRYYVARLLDELIDKFHT